MTQAKKLKKTIRARARKTGESYTAARRQVLAARRRPATVARPEAPFSAPARPRLAPDGEAGVVKKTGRGYDHWFGVLDAFGASAKGHKASAAHLYGEHGVPGWHSQMITVAYEQHRGLRVPNQSCDGDFQVSVSKVVPVPVKAIAKVLTDPRHRSAWLEAADPELRKAVTAAFKGPKPRKVTVKDEQNARLRFRWDESTVEIRITGKANGRSSIAVGNMGLAEATLVEKRRTQWRGALEALRDHLTA